MDTKSLPAEDPILTWSAVQNHHVKRGTLWYILAGITLVTLIVYSVITAAWTFTILIILLGGLYWKFHNEEPAEKTIRIWKRGFAIDTTWYDWHRFTGYWILQTKDFAELHLEKTKGGEVKIQTGDESVYEIHEKLSPLLPELEEKREHILDTIIRICKL